MGFHILGNGHFNIDHCYDCLVPGYLIVSPVVPVSSLVELPPAAQAALGPTLAAATEAVRAVVHPLKIYCAQFGEEGQWLHFHVFPRTPAVTEEFIRAFPEQQDLVHGPVLLDWARSTYRVARAEVWREVSPLIPLLQRELNRIIDSSI